VGGDCRIIGVAIKTIIFDWGWTLYDPQTKTFFPEALKVVQALAGKYKLAIVSLATKGQPQIQERNLIIQETGIGKYFKFILFAESNKGKLYEKTLQELGVSAEEAAIVDDRTIRGIRWGNQHGCMTIWLERGKFSNELPNEETGEPTHTIKNLDELLTIFS